MRPGKPAPFSQILRDYQDRRFAEAQQAAGAYLSHIIDNLPDYCLREDLGNIYDVSVSAIVTSHRETLKNCRILQGLQEYARQPAVELIFIANGLDGGDAESYPAGTRVFVMPENIGCSAARNIGAYVARGQYLLFLDDDGETGPDDLETLVRTCMDEGAAAVRGRVSVASESGLGGPHYDLGESLRPEPPTTEGFCAWKKAHFDKFGGFDPLLFGHEGLDLCSRMLSELEPERFLYQPKAVLRHDYASDEEDLSRKHKRMQHSDTYLDFKGVKKGRVRAAFRPGPQSQAC